ncbi:helix-hairpin-helix domain-containing protein [Pandoraea sp. NPDC087047]|uniref:helix-hairpin-helix domain-containing protein n=1 Tax=Pandoraea sp. NPDC087047 TaxID=3364390 RepID=UPI003817EB54
MTLPDRRQFDIIKSAVERMEANMGSKRQELIEVLAKLADLLEIKGGQHWRAWLLRAKARLENADYSGIEYLLQAYGGMGSFNDFVAPQSAIEGQPTGKPGYVELNDEIDALRTEAWEIATDIKHNHEVQRT